jgi:geranylgeranyl pyrophosphate synthase
MGKHSTDAKNNKCTFVTLLGLAKAREYAQIYHAQALDSLSLFGPQADPLRDLSTYIIERVA